MQVRLFGTFPPNSKRSSKIRRLDFKPVQKRGVIFFFSSDSYTIYYHVPKNDLHQWANSGEKSHVKSLHVVTSSLWENLFWNFLQVVLHSLQVLRHIIRIYFLQLTSYDDGRSTGRTQLPKYMNENSCGYKL